MILHKSFDINEKGHLTIAGADAVELAEKFGTPSYIIDAGAVRENCRIYNNAVKKYFGGDSVPLYASKALSFTGIYKLVNEEGLGADCVSPGEIMTAANAGFPMEKVYFHGNNKTDADIELAVRMGVGHFVVDNHEELNALDEIAGKLGVKQKILLRITPGIDPHTHKKIMTGNIDSKFGSAIATGQAEEIVAAALKCRNAELTGLHCHVGSQIFDIEPFADAADIMLEFIAHLNKKYGWLASELNLGGGMGVRYTEDDPFIDYDKNIGLIAERINAECEKHNIKRPKIMLEPGRSLVAAAGATVYKIGSVKEIPGFRNYVSVDGGMPDNPRYALYSSQYTIVNASKASEKADFECTVGGRCCESGDLLAEDIKIVKPVRGDIMAVLVTGAYNYSMASNYNRIPRPPVVMIENGKAEIAVKRETYDDLTALDVK